MSNPQSPKAAPVRRTRKSIAHLPSPDVSFDKENTEHGISSTSALSKVAGKKGRSKSLGPGGLDALKADAGNRQPVGMHH
jgi:kinetochore protein Spc7/SPC105